MSQHYVGTKIIEAWPQQQVQGQDVREGYAVKYADGYISWSPKDTFEASYLPLGHISHLSPHVQRMHAESAELNDRLAKLNGFLETPAFLTLEEDDRDLLVAQGKAMTAYWNALEARINRACAPQPTTPS